MKKIVITLLALTTSVIPLTAEESDTTLQFVTSAGEVIADGAEITVTAASENMFGATLTPDLWAKNTSGESVYASVSYTLSEMDNGTFQICFPINCVQQTSTGSWETDKGTMSAGESRTLLTEWIADLNSYGTAKAKYQLNLYTYNKVTKTYKLKAAGPTVTVIYTYSEDSNNIVLSEADSAGGDLYNLSGQRVGSGYRGIVIGGGRKKAVR